VNPVRELKKIADALEDFIELGDLSAVGIQSLKGGIYLLQSDTKYKVFASRDRKGMLEFIDSIGRSGYALAPYGGGGDTEVMILDKQPENLGVGYETSEVGGNIIIVNSPRAGELIIALDYD